jgi:hypothetical protein
MPNNPTVDPAAVFPQTPVTPIHPQPQDLSNAIAHCEVEIKRLSLTKKHPTMMLWCAINGYPNGWPDLDYNGFRHLWRFLKKCN